MLKFLGVVVVLVIVVILALAATKPSSYHVERSLNIQAPPDRIATQVNDFHNWVAWSPWQHLDPDMKTTYSGPTSGPGAIYEWTGNSKVGAGRMEILSADPSKTSIKLDFLKPFEAHNTSNFTYQPDGAATRVTWSMDGPASFMTKVMMVFSSMDKMMGPDFENGLNNLKKESEK